MENIDKADLITHLENIGFQPLSEQPEIMEYYYDNELIVHLTINGGNIISLEDHQIKQIATQCKLNEAEFEKLSIGKLTNKQYEKILSKQGFIG